MALHAIHGQSGPANPAHKVDVVQLLESTEMNGFHPLGSITEPGNILFQVAAIASAVSNALDDGPMPDQVTQGCMAAINTLAGLATFIQEHRA